MDPFPSDEMMRYIYENYAEGDRAMANEYITWLLDQRGDPTYEREFGAILHMMGGGRYPVDHVNPENEDDFCRFYNPQMHYYTLHDLVLGMHPDFLTDWMGEILGPEPLEERPDSPEYEPMDLDAPAHAYHAPPRPRPGPAHRMPLRVAQMCARTASGKCLLGTDLRKLDIRKRAVLTCGHVFEKSAIQPWIASNGTCPYCKADAKIQRKNSHGPHDIPPQVSSRLSAWALGRACHLSKQPLTAANSCVTNCGHVFDRPALTAHLQTHGNKCPICKNKNCRIIRGGYHKTKRRSKSIKSRKYRKSTKCRPAMNFPR